MRVATHARWSSLAAIITIAAAMPGSAWAQEADGLDEEEDPLELPDILVEAPRLLDEAAPASVISRERLDEAVDVLLDNALKYGAAPVTVRLEASGGTARVVITDSGPGVPHADRTRIFDKLTRGARPDQPGGFGVGLWAARKVAEAHGGTLTLEGDSSFVLTLPGAH